jgi:hypothetical protein
MYPNDSKGTVPSPLVNLIPWENPPLLQTCVVYMRFKAQQQVYTDTYYFTMLFLGAQDGVYVQVVSLYGK